jgi:hypothetical protein
LKEDDNVISKEELIERVCIETGLSKDSEVFNFLGLAQ